MIVRLKFVYSVKATKFFNLRLSTVHTDKSKLKISQNFVAFSEYFVNEMLFDLFRDLIKKGSNQCIIFGKLVGHPKLLLVSKLSLLKNYKINK